MNGGDLLHPLVEVATAHRVRQLQARNGVWHPAQTGLAAFFDNPMSTNNPPLQDPMCSMTDLTPHAN
jgi:hypothetical protein